MSGRDCIETGYAVMKEIDGVPLFWGTLYQGIGSKVESWGSIKTATIVQRLVEGKDEMKPTDFTYPGSPVFNKLKSGKVVKLQRITTFKLL